MKAYTVHYRMTKTEEVKAISFKAIYDIIPSKEGGEPPYYAYVYSVTYQNGNQKIFKM